jgi:hypothetical protein
MKSVTLRTLLREPLKVKRLTRSGAVVQVTDQGEPLWTIQAAKSAEPGEAERAKLIEEALEDVLTEKPSSLPLSKVILDSRR